MEVWPLSNKINSYVCSASLKFRCFNICMEEIQYVKAKILTDTGNIDQTHEVVVAGIPNKKIQLHSDAIGRCNVAAIKHKLPQLSAEIASHFRISRGILNIFGRHVNYNRQPVIAFRRKYGKAVARKILGGISKHVLVISCFFLIEISKY